MGQHRFIVDHLKGLKNSYKGREWERTLSIYWHQRYTPVLISPTFLRSRGAGQIDIAYADAKSIRLVECKQSCYPTPAQLSRLRKAQQLLSHVFSRPVLLDISLAIEHR